MLREDREICWTEKHLT